VNKERDERLLEIFREKAVLRGDFTLSSGLKASYYVDGRMVTLWPEGSYLIGKKVLDILDGAGIEAVGGMTVGADPIATAVSLVSHLEGRNIPAFIVRSGVKEHGTQKVIEGPVKDWARVAIVDDVLTTGGSIIRAIEAVEAKGCSVVKVVVLLDRQQGGADEIRRRGYDLAAIFTADSDGNINLA